MSETLSNIFGDEPIDPIVDQLFTSAPNEVLAKVYIVRYDRHIKNGATPEEALAVVQKLVGQVSSVVAADQSLEQRSN